MNPAIFVLGPESSGTRALTQLFLAAGAWGSPDHAQALDNEATWPLIPRDAVPVWRRSYPHGGGYPVLCAMVRRAIAYNFSPHFVALVRSSPSTLYSAVKRGHAKTDEEAAIRYRESLALLFGQMLALPSVPFHVLTYESLGEPWFRCQAVELFGLEGAAAKDFHWSVRGH